MHIQTHTPTHNKTKSSFSFTVWTLKLRPSCTFFFLSFYFHPSGSCIWWLFFRFVNNSFALTSLHRSFSCVRNTVKKKKKKKKNTKSTEKEKKEKTLCTKANTRLEEQDQESIFVCWKNFSFSLFLYHLTFFFLALGESNFFFNLLVSRLLFFVHSFVTLGANENEITAFHVERKRMKHSSVCLH